MPDALPDSGPTPEAKELVAELKKWGLFGLTDDNFALALDAFRREGVEKERDYWRGVLLAIGAEYGKVAERNAAERRRIL